MKQPLVSIVVPAYNYGRYLAACIDSLLAQTYPNWELIVVNNGSTDNTLEVLAGYSDPRITKLRIDTNEGPIPAWDLGYRHCQGEYFALLPADDYFKPEKLERQIAYLNTHPEVTALATYVEEVDEHGMIPQTKGFMEDYINQQVDFNNPENWRWKHYFCIPTALYSKKICDLATGVPDHGLDSMCDWDFHVKLIGAGIRFAVLPEKLTCYRWHRKNTSLNSKNAYREWVYSHAKNYLPVIRRTVGNPLSEITACVETLFQNPTFLNGYTPGQRCAMLEVMLDPEGGVSSFSDFGSFHAYCDFWKVDSECSAALAAIDSLLSKSASMSEELEKLRFTSEQLRFASASIAGELEIMCVNTSPMKEELERLRKELEGLRKEVKRLRKFRGFVQSKFRRLREKIRKSIGAPRNKP